MMKLRVEYAAGTCIGQGSCVIASPEYFSLRNKKAILKGAKLENKIMVLEKEFDHPEQIIDAAKNCPVNAIKIIDVDSKETMVSNKVESSDAKTVVAHYDDATEFTLDPEGYFLIRVNTTTKNIEVGFCNAKNKVVLTVIGTKPVEIYHTIINVMGLNIRKDHCAYLGRELQKAQIALQLGIKYVQDDELDLH